LGFAWPGHRPRLRGRRTVFCEERHGAGRIADRGSRYKDLSFNDLHSLT
jgi:hypothetical protein